MNITTRQTRTGAGAFLLAVGLALAVPGLGDAATAADAPTPADPAPTDAEVNRSLDFLAKNLAAAGSRADVRTTIHDSVKKRFDGDADALWSSIDTSSGFSAKVAQRSAQSSGAIARAAAKMPRLQVAVPVGLESWDPATYAPLVAYFPQGVDDTSVKTITAYDADGKATTLDAKVAPKRPVIVLSLNERTDKSGRLLARSDSSSPKVQTGQASKRQAAAAAAAPAKYSVDIRMVHLIDAKEPWAKGDAEIAMKARSKGCSGTEYTATNWENLNDDDDWWAPGGTRNLGLTTCDVVFYWWEDDGGSADFTLSYGGFSLGVQMDDDDDLIGGKQVPYASFKGGGTDTWRKDEWPALAQWTE